MADSATHRGDSSEAHAPRARQRDTLKWWAHANVCRFQSSRMIIFFLKEREREKIKIKTSALPRAFKENNAFLQVACL